MTEPRMTPAALQAFVNKDHLNGTIASSRNGIEKQEALGQKNLLESQRLPIQGDWDILTRWGVLKEENVDSLFLSAKLPNGWHIEGTDHSLWSKLVDDRGLIRASIFYKATFYEKEAFIKAKASRFSIVEYRQKNGIQFECIDRGRDQAIQRFKLGTYGVLKSDPIVIGFIFDGKFYSKIQGDPWDAEFCQEFVSAELAIPISKDEFYKNFHHVSERHDLINASEKKAKNEADEWLNPLPKDDSQWNAEFDFPEYTEAIA